MKGEGSWCIRIGTMIVFNHADRGMSAENIADIVRMNRCK